MNKEKESTFINLFYAVRALFNCMRDVSGPGMSSEVLCVVLIGLAILKSQKLRNIIGTVDVYWADIAHYKKVLGIALHKRSTQVLNCQFGVHLY